MAALTDERAVASAAHHNAGQGGRDHGLPWPDQPCSCCAGDVAGMTATQAHARRLRRLPPTPPLRTAAAPQSGSRRALVVRRRHRGSPAAPPPHARRGMPRRRAARPRRMVTSPVAQPGEHRQPWCARPRPHPRDRVPARTATVGWARSRGRGLLGAAPKVGPSLRIGGWRCRDGRAGQVERPEPGQPGRPRNSTLW